MIYELGQSMEGSQVVKKLIAAGDRIQFDRGERITVRKIPSLIGTLPDGEIYTNRNLAVGIEVTHEQYDEGSILLGLGRGWKPVQAEYPSHYGIRLPALDESFPLVNGRSVRVDQLVRRDNTSIGNLSEQSPYLVVQHLDLELLHAGTEWIDPRLEDLLKEEFPDLKRHWLGQSLYGAPIRGSMGSIASSHRSFGVGPRGL